jgi:hypothetical protein
MKDDISPIKLAPDQERIAAEITRLLGRWSEYPRIVVLGRVRHCIDTLIRGLPIAKEFFNRSENKVHAERLVEAIDTLKHLIATAPKGLVWSFLLHPDDPFYMQLDRIRRVCARESPWHHGLLGPEFGHDPRYGLTEQWCAEFGANLMKEVAPTARISSTDRTSLFRQVAGLLKGAVTGLDLKRAREVDIERACDRVIKELGQ